MINKEEATFAVDRLGALQYFPGDTIARVEIAKLLMRMVDQPVQLNWLVRAMIDRVGAWKGTRELRAVYCTRYKPLDGIEQWSELPGFTAADSESEYVLAHSHYKELKDNGHQRGPSDLGRINPPN